MEGYETVYDLEEPAGEPEPEGEPGQETASGNDLSVSGNDSAASDDVTVFPEGYDLSAPGGELLLM